MTDLSALIARVEEGPRKLEVVEIDTLQVVRTINVEKRSEREIEKIMRGMLINMSDRFFVRDTGAIQSKEGPTHDA